MLNPLFPDDGLVDRAAAVVEPILLRHGLNGKAKHIARRVARVTLRTAYFSRVEPQPDVPRQPPSDLRWCNVCGGDRETVYRDVAYRCVICGHATTAIITPVDVL